MQIQGLKQKTRGNNEEPRETKEYNRTCMKKHESKECTRPWETTADNRKQGEHHKKTKHVET